MRIDLINVYKVLLPFSGEFSHSIRKRLFSNNIVVEIISEDKDINGYGEGAPRSYVTGETQDKAADSIVNLISIGDFPWELDSVDNIWDFVDSLPNGKGNNAAICSLEMALLDILAKREKNSVSEYFSQDFYVNTIHYGGGIPLGSPERVEVICSLIKRMGINKLKLKMGKDIEQNRTSLEVLSDIFNKDYDLKVDVNGAWNQKEGYDHMPMLREYNVKVVEQPMVPGDPGIAEFSKIAKEARIELMADESACSLDEVKDLAKDGYYDMINMRISKCGGFRRSFKIIDYLREKGIPFQVGCQLGESGLLSAAGRALGTLCRDAVYYDGSYDKYLLKENITCEDVSFGNGGMARALDRPGLGVEVDKDKLESLSDISSIITVKRPV